MVVKSRSTRILCGTPVGGVVLTKIAPCTTVCHCASFALSYLCSDRSTNKPVGQQKSACWLTNQPIGYWANPLLSIRNITLFGQRPSPLDNGLFGQATGRPVGERSGPKDVPCALGWQPALGCQGLPGPARVPLRLLFLGQIAVNSPAS
jgi:hypothetical protein